MNCLVSYSPSLRDHHPKLVGCEEIKAANIVIPKKKRKISAASDVECIPMALSQPAQAISNFIEDVWPDTDPQIEPFQFNRTTFSILLTSRSHYCKIKEQMIGDPIHHSNHVFFIADLVHKTYIQRCHNEQYCSYINEDGTVNHLTSDYFPFSREISEMIDQFFHEFYLFADEFISCFYE